MYLPLVVCLLPLALTLGVPGQHESHQAGDSFDEITRAMNKVTEDNCKNHVEDLFLPEGSVSHLPDSKYVNIEPVFYNRTKLWHVHNMAVTRAFFWSYILQTTDDSEPGKLYSALTTMVAISKNDDIDASAIYLAPNTNYASSYRGCISIGNTTKRTSAETVSIHGTINAQLLDDGDPDHHPYDFNYYRVTEWYKQWLPDVEKDRRDTKTSYKLVIRYANNETKSIIFYGPPAADDTPGPVKWTRPYFDCGRSNRWLIATVVPIVNITVGLNHSKYPKYTAVAVEEIEFGKIDINQCPSSDGNSGLNWLADTAKCKKDTTECEPVEGFGFRRGGYQCRCRPFYRLPLNASEPYLGEILEKSTNEEYNKGFDCKKIERIQEIPIFWEKLDPRVRETILDSYSEYRSQITGPETLKQPKLNIRRVLEFIYGVNKDTCKKYKPEELILPRGVMYGAAKFYENEAKAALRLSNFISAFLQVFDYTKTDSDKPLNADQIIGETVAIVMGNNRIWSAGTYWEKHEFANRTLFAPYVYKKDLNTRTYYAEDTEESIIDEPWLKILKDRWNSEAERLDIFWLNDTNHVETIEQLKHFLNHFNGARLEQGHWTPPYFDCYGKEPRWTIKYVAPFFGWDYRKIKFEVKGVVAVTMALESLDINQCSGDNNIENAFKDTHKCDIRSSHCVPIPGRGFDFGGYKCECNAGWEYPFEDPITYYDGQLVESAFNALVDDKATRFDVLKCRQVQ